MNANLRATRAGLIAAALLAAPCAFSQERANPDSRPLKDRSEKASPESQPVEDEKRQAGERTVPAGKEARPIEDDDGRANERSGKERDSDKAANPESRKTDDRVPRRASPETRRTRDGTTGKADPDASKVEDSNKDKANPDARETSAAERRRHAAPAPAAARELPPEEAAVIRAHEELSRDLHRRKLRIQGRDEARGMIDEILGKDSRISRAEILRAEAAEERRAEREDRRAAARFLRQRLRGEAEVRDLPPFFRTIAPAEAAADEPVLPGPYFIHQGRRYVYYPSREAIPPVLMATAALDRVTIQPVAELDAAVFGERIPVDYRGGESWVVSYPVAANTTITSHDILFRQGSTRFADAHSYDMVLALTDAMLDPGLADRHFVIEGHASAEGSTLENQTLSQLRAEAIVRELVRGGVAAERLVPVGYGEAEAHHPADAAENLRRQDRRVVVSRIDLPAE